MPEKSVDPGFVFSVALLLFGQMIASTAVLAIKMSILHPGVLGALRLLTAALLLTPRYLRDSRRLGRSAAEMKAEALPSVLPGILLALHFISWNYGARLTLAANASLIVNMMPVAMPFIMFLLMGSRIRRGELIGTAAAMAGVLVLTGDKLRLGGATVTGDLICFGSMLLFALYIAYAKRNNRQSTVWLYVVPLYWAAGLTALALSAPLVPGSGLWAGGLHPQGSALAKEGLYVLFLGVFPTIIGHTIFNRSMSHLPSQLVSIGMLTQFIFAGLFAFLLFGEQPQAAFLPAAALVIAGALAVIRAP